MQEFIATAKEYPVVSIFGPRQSGKTTLAKIAFPQKKYINLENPDTRSIAELDPRGFLAQFPEGVIIDEIQRVPSLLSYIQEIVDTNKTPGFYIITGSHQPLLSEAISQSLAGRTAILTLLPLSLSELHQAKIKTESFDLMHRGFYPNLHAQNLDPRRFYNAYQQTYIERDVRSLIMLKDLSLFQKFLVLLAGRVGQLVNYTSLANDTGVSSTTIRAWISVLKASYVIFELPPFFKNIQKRLIKSSKLYFTDTGLLSHLLGINSKEQVFRDPLRGNIFENLIILDIYKNSLNKGIVPNAYFFRDSNGNEIDLILQEGRNIVAYEIKSGATFNPEYLKTLNAMESLGFSHIASKNLIYNGIEKYSVKDINIIPFSDFGK